MRIPGIIQWKLKQEMACSDQQGNCWYDQARSLEKYKEKPYPNQSKTDWKKMGIYNKWNGVYQACLCVLGYFQLPGLDFTNDLSPVIIEVTFWIVLIIMVKYSWIGEIIDVQTVFYKAFWTKKYISISLLDWM